MVQASGDRRQERPGASVSDVTGYPHGTPSWVDLATTDVDAATRFYADLFGWERDETPPGMTIFRLHGRPVAGLHRQDEEQRSEDVPPAWKTHVTVSDVEETAAKVEPAGGILVSGPSDAGDAGRMAVVEDPGAATLVLWHPRGHTGTGAVEEPGSMAWNELWTRDTTGACAFYKDLFGWGEQVGEVGGTFYTTFTRAGRPVAGMVRTPEQWGGMPPYWLVYFSVERCDASSENARRLGGSVKVAPIDVAIRVPSPDVPGAVRVSVLRDPQGAVFGIVEFSS